MLEILKSAYKVDKLTAIVWSLSMLFQLLRANILLLLSFRRPSLIFTARHSRLQGMRHASIGTQSRIEKGARITAWPNGEFRIGKKFSLGEASILENGFNINSQKGVIVIGDNVGVGAFSFISSPSCVEIGNDCIIGQYFSVHAQNHNFDGAELIRLQGTVEKGVHIGNNCWIGAKVTILDGVVIGSGSVIAAGAIVTKCFPERSVIAGCPAKLIKRL